MDFESFDATTAAAVVVGAVLLWVVLGDARALLQRLLAGGANAEKPTGPPAAAAATIEQPKAATGQAAAEPESEAASTAAPAEAQKPADPLEHLLEDALETMDTEETVIDDAWDKVHERMQVSTHVNGLHDLVQQGMKAFQETAERQKALKKEESSDRNAVQKAEHFRRQGDRFMSKKKYDEATVQFSSAIRLLPDKHPEKHVVYCQRSEANAEKKDGTAALKDATKCLELKPGHPRGRLCKAKALEVLKRWGEAKSLYDALGKECPEHEGAAREGAARCDDALLDLLDD